MAFLEICDSQNILKKNYHGYFVRKSEKHSCDLGILMFYKLS